MIRAYSNLLITYSKARKYTTGVSTIQFSKNKPSKLTLIGATAMPTSHLSVLKQRCKHLKDKDFYLGTLYQTDNPLSSM
jgi:hypothetical protein